MEIIDNEFKVTLILGQEGAGKEVVNRERHGSETGCTENASDNLVSTRKIAM